MERTLRRFGFDSLEVVVFDPDQERKCESAGVARALTVGDWQFTRGERSEATSSSMEVYHEPVRLPVDGTA